MKKALALVIILCMIFTTCTVAASADDYPKSNFTLITDAKAGSDVDTICRKFATVAEKYSDCTWLVENTPGGSGVLALQSLMSKKADGYSLLLHSISLPITMATGDCPYTFDNCIPLAALFDDSVVLTVRSDGQFKSIEDVIAYAKEHPGELNVGAAKAKASMHLLVLRICSLAGIEVNYVAYDDATSAKVALLGGDVSVIASTPDNVREDCKAGTLSMIATTAPERPEEAPECKTFDEIGLEDVTGYAILRGFFIKAGVPEERVEKLGEIVKQVEDDPEWIDFCTNTLGKNMRYMNREEYTDYNLEFVAFATELFAALDN